jgi:hypothetical protein
MQIDKFIKFFEENQFLIEDEHDQDSIITEPKPLNMKPTINFSYKRDQICVKLHDNLKQGATLITMFWCFAKV